MGVALEYMIRHVESVMCSGIKLGIECCFFSTLLQSGVADCPGTSSCGDDRLQVQSTNSAPKDVPDRRGAVEDEPYRFALLRTKCNEAER
jgi:hypothetical protein